LSSGVPRIEVVPRAMARTTSGVSTPMVIWDGKRFRRRINVARLRWSSIGSHRREI
jgi:hypothetical protein